MRNETLFQRMLVQTEDKQILTTITGSHSVNSASTTVNHTTVFFNNACIMLQIQTIWRLARTT